jgi:hypothetical protein
MPRSAIATDNFNRANGTLGSNWSDINAGNADVLLIDNNQVYGQVAGHFGVSRWNGAGTFSNDQYSSAKLKAIDNYGTSYGIGVVARCSADTDGGRDYYYVMVQMTNTSGGTFTTVLGKVVNGTNTNLHSAAVTWSNDDLVSIECEGTTIRACKNGAALGGSFTATDSALSTGKPGLAVMGPAATGLFYADDWEGGDITASSSASITGAVGAGTFTGISGRMDLGVKTHTSVRG